ncbi:hypothetical protein EV702DRAFT_1180007 [Suillus placidus]|uniref:Uncharacterized protein n=1 Tax=Suillus placidus TaxID=48579 RepID=A0A9P6ZTT9_9AGAM|nr:hypothetical protein EV702DRAFT_1180007 [Suillus placidus]
MPFAISAQHHQNSHNFDQNPSFEDDRDVPAPLVEHRETLAMLLDNLVVPSKFCPPHFSSANALHKFSSFSGIIRRAADLFPRKISHQQREFLINPNLMDRNREARGRKSMPGYSLDLESLPEQTIQYPAVQRYVHDLTAEMGEHNDSITGTVSMCLEVTHDTANLFNSVHHMLSDGVNAFWFSSFVFSIAPAVNGLLGLSWKQAMYQSPGDCIPWWVLIWIKPPLVFLVMCVAYFSAGLVLFTYSTHQGKVTSTITTTVLLPAVLAWFASEKWTFVHHRESKWLSDVLKDALRRFMALRLVSLVSKSFGWGSRYVQKGVEVAGHKFRRPASGEYAHTISRSPEPLAPLSPIRQSTDSYSHLSGESSSHPNLKSPTTTFSGTSNSPITPSVRLISVIRFVMMLQSAMSFPGNAFSFPARKRTTFLALTDVSRVTSPTGVTTTFRGSRAACLIPKLKSLEATQDLAAHSALVRHLHLWDILCIDIFSIAGIGRPSSSASGYMVLVVDQNVAIIFLQDPCVPHRVLAHAPVFVDQVAWCAILALCSWLADVLIKSPAGVLILTRLNRAIKNLDRGWLSGKKSDAVSSYVLFLDGLCRMTIESHHHVQSVAWRGRKVVKLVLDTYRFNRVSIHDVAITPDLQRLLGVGPILYSPKGLHPSKSRVEKQLLVYDIKTKVIESETIGMISQTPVLHDAFPQLWKLEIVKDQAQLILRHTYMPKVPVDFAGPSYFGGKDDQFVLCTGKALGRDLTCIAWNYASDNPFMFATGSHDGAVRLWTTANDYRPLCESSRHPFAMTAQYLSRILLPLARLQYSVVDKGARTDSAGTQCGEYTSEPLALTVPTPAEDGG